MKCQDPLLSSNGFSFITNGREIDQNNLIRIIKSVI